MRIAVIFLITLCYLLMGQQLHVFADTQNTHSCFYHQTSKNKKTIAIIKRTIFKKHRNAFRNHHIDKENEYLNNDDVEDEDTNNLFLKKQGHPATNFTVHNYQSILKYLYHNRKAYPSFCCKVSDKYITQRTLRI